MDQVKRRGRPPKQQPATEPAVSFEREFVQPSVKPVVFAVPIPEHLKTSAIPTDSLATMPADIRCAIEARLGCIFALKQGDITTQRGELFRVVVGDQVEVHPR